MGHSRHSSDSSLPLLLALALLALPTAGQTLRRVRVEHGLAPAQAAAFVHSLEADGLDVLEGSVGASSLELVVSLAQLDDLRRRGHAPVVLEIGRPYRSIQGSQPGSGLDIPSGYPDLNQVIAQMNATAAAFPSICRVVNLTTTYGLAPTHEGRDLFAVVVSDNVNTAENEPAFLLVANHHCREIMTPVLALDAMTRLTTQYGSDPTITSIVDANEIWIAPVWNPDGYEYVFNVDNLWRKNRRPVGGGQFGVDLNRNYPLGWTSPCAGASTGSATTYKGPSPGSEAETQTMLALGGDRNFAKVIDFHSYGREVLWSYACLPHPFASWLQSEAALLSAACGYGGQERTPSADGEHYQWQLGARSAYSFLVEIGTAFQPTYANAQNEANQVWGGILAMLQRPVSVHGNITDACTGEGISATIAVAGANFVNGEMNQSSPLNGRYHSFLPPGSWTLIFTAPGYAPRSMPVTVTASSQIQVDLMLNPQASVSLSGTMQPGTTVGVSFDSLSDAMNPYLAGASVSGTVPGIPFGGCNLPLNVDFLTGISVSNQGPFSGFTGVLDGSGHGSGAVALPADPALVGLRADIAFVTLDGVSGVPRHPSSAAALIVSP